MRNTSARWRGSQRRLERSVGREGFIYTYVYVCMYYQNLTIQNPKLKNSNKTDSLNLPAICLITSYKYQPCLTVSIQGGRWCSLHSSSFTLLVELLMSSLALESPEAGEDTGFWSLKGIDACFLRNLYNDTTVRSVSTGIC